MTGTVDSSAPQVITDQVSDALQLSFVNSSGAALTQGQEVTLKSDGTLDKRDAGTDKPLGIVMVGAVDGARATVRTPFIAVVNAIAIGGTINANTYVKPNGTKNSDNYPQYVACAAGDYASALVIKGGAVNTVIKVAILNAPFQINP